MKKYHGIKTEGGGICGGVELYSSTMGASRVVAGVLKTRRLLAVAGVVLAFKDIGVAAAAAAAEDPSSPPPGGRVAIGVESTTTSPIMFPLPSSSFFFVQMAKRSLLSLPQTASAVMCVYNATRERR